MLGEQYEFRVQGLDLLVEHSPFIPQFQDQASDARRQNVIVFGKQPIKRALERHATGSKYHTPFQKNCAELIDQGRALRNQA